MTEERYKYASATYELCQTRKIRKKMGKKNKCTENALNNIVLEKLKCAHTTTICKLSILRTSTPFLFAHKVGSQYPFFIQENQQRPTCG